ncbi:MAG: c-type cytochrome [Akkermansiaceae bacterium]
MILKYSIIATAIFTAVVSPVAAQKKKGKAKKEKPVKHKVVHAHRMHPFFALEGINMDGVENLKVGGMCFHEGSLYVVTFSPDRTNKSPDHNGKLIRVDNLANGGEPKLTILCEGFYEPAAVGVVGKSIYVGTKTQFLRFTDGIGKDKLDIKSATVMLDGTSTINFHTYTIGFEPYMKDGKQYLCGNFTTAILLGGKRDVMIPPNKDVHRGSTFVFGPVTGSESPESVSIEYIAGGYRTPNGIEVGPDNEVYVADNQGIFNPSNKLIRLTPGSFYGHYLRTKNGKASAFQPKDVNAEAGDVKQMTPPTLHLPQEIVARSPSQPHVIHDRKGILAPYNGQILLGDFTTGQILRASLEEVEGTWQGVVFKHTSGKSDKNGDNGLHGGPNRILEGPDGNYYIGEIGAGRLWEFNGAQYGLQRLRVKQAGEVPADFNEILNVKACEGGFELEFLKPIDPKLISVKDINVMQWTYHPTPNYGGPQIAPERLAATKLNFDESGKKAVLIIDGLKDGSDIVGQGKKTNHNSGWVVQIGFDPKKNGKSVLYTKEFWYTMHKRVGEKKDAVVIQIDKNEQSEMKFKSLCMACHRENDGGWGAPNLVGILGRKQTVIRDGKEVKVTVDEAYMLNAIMNPMAEKPKKFKDAVMADPGLDKEQALEMIDYIKSLK